jgi:hypothetical protein
MPGFAANQLHSFIGGEQRFFPDIDPNPHNQLIDKPTAALDDIEMPESNGVKGSGVNSTA